MPHSHLIATHEETAVGVRDGAQAHRGGDTRQRALDFKSCLQMNNDREKALVAATRHFSVQASGTLEYHWYSRGIEL